MINLRQISRFYTKSQIGRQILAITLAFSIGYPHGYARSNDGGAANEDKQEQDGDKSFFSFQNALKKGKKIYFQFRHTGTNETVNAEFEDMPNERWPVPQIRRHFVEQELEEKRFLQFIKNYIQHNIKDVKGNFYRSFVEAGLKPPPLPPIMVDTFDPNVKQTAMDPSQPTKVTNTNVVPYGTHNYNPEKQAQDSQKAAAFIHSQLANDFYAQQFFARLPRHIQADAYRQYEVFKSKVFNAKGVYEGAKADAKETYDSFRDRYWSKSQPTQERGLVPYNPLRDSDYRSEAKPRLSTRRISENIKKSLLYQNLRKPLNMGPYGLPAQSIMFAGINGAMMILQLKLWYADDPMAWLNHLESMTDPYGVLSIYTMFAMSGLTVNLFEKKFGGIQNVSYKTKAMKAAMPWVGMAAGILISSLTPEIINLVKTCSMASLKGTSTSILDSAPGKRSENVDPCDKAQSDFFNFENKVEQYIPMMFSLALSAGVMVSLMKTAQGVMWAGNKVSSNTTVQNAMSGMASRGQALGQSVAQGAKNAVNGLADTSWGYRAANQTVDLGNKIKGSAFFKGVVDTAKSSASKTISGIKFIGIRISTKLSPWGWSFTGASIAVGVIDQASNGIFLWVDHQTLPAIGKFFAQFIRATFVRWSDATIKRSFIENELTGWNMVEGISADCDGKEDAKKAHCYRDMRLALTYLHDEMEMWREQNHGKFFAGVVGWTRMMNTFMQEMIVTEKFYKWYIEEVFRAKKYQVKASKKEGFTADELRQATFLPFRKTALYGVTPYEMDPMYTAAHLYILKPQEMQELQMDQLKFVANTLLPLFSVRNYENRDRKGHVLRHTLADDKQEQQQQIDAAVWEHAKKLSKETFFLIPKILNDLKSTDINVVVKTLLRINQAAQTTEFGNEPDAIEFFKFLRGNLGEPMPMAAAGMVMPYAYDETIKDDLEGLKPRRAIFSRYSEYLIYQMLCGPQATSNNVVVHTMMGGARFYPPRIVTGTNLRVEWTPQNSPITTALCEYSIPFQKLYYSKIIDPKTGQKVPFFEYLNNNIDPTILGNYTNTAFESETNVKKWWEELVPKAVESMFKRLDKEYQTLLVELVHGLQPDGVEWKDEKYEFTGGVIKTTKASRSLLYSNMQEANFYLSVLSRLENLPLQSQRQVLAGQAAAAKEGPSPAMKDDIEKLRDIEDQQVGVKKNSKSLLEDLNFMPVAQSQSQVEFVKRFTKLIEYLQDTKVAQNAEYLQVQLPQNGKKAGDIAKEIIESLEPMQKALDAMKLTPYQSQVASLAFKNLAKNVNNLTGYILNIQLTNFSALDSYQSYVSSNRKYMDEKQNKQKHESFFNK